MSDDKALDAEIEEMALLVMRDASTPHRAAGRLSPRALRRAAALYLRDRAADKRRQRALEVEREASQPGPSAPAPRRDPSPVDEARYERNRAAWAARLEEDARQRQARSVARLAEAVAGVKKALADEMVVEWTHELLESEIAMPNGDRVTWGVATLDQHQERIEMFDANTKANLEGAVRHQKAVEYLQATGAACLAEAVASSANVRMRA